MPAKSKKAQLTAAELAQFKAMHAEVDLARERKAHWATAVKVQQLEHELALMRQSSAHNAAMRLVEQRDGELDRDVAAARQAATAFAETLSKAYAVDLQTHAVNPHTGEFMRLDEGTHG